jgi:hypothetical protein
MVGFISMFLNPWALAIGLLAISVPIIIHLINRMQFRRVRWAAMEFLLAAQKRMRQRLLIEQLLLLLLRILLMLLMGLLLSRWLVSGTPPAPSVDLVLHDVLLDDSMSMSDREPAQGEERPAFQSVRDESVRLAKSLEKSRLPCRLRMRVASNPDNPIFDQMITDGSSNELQQLLAKISAQPIRIPLVGPIQTTVDAALALTEPGKIRRVLHLMSDMRANDWSDGTLAVQLVRLAEQNGEVRLLDCASPARMVDSEPPSHGNLAIVGLFAETRSALEGQPVGVTALVANFGRNPRRAGMSVFINGLRDASASSLIESLPPGQVTPVRFRVVPVRPTGAPQAVGTPTPDPVQRDTVRRADPVIMVIRVSLEDDSRMGVPADDVRDLIVPVRTRFPVLVVDGAATGRADGSTGNDALYLGAALNPQIFDTEFRDSRELAATDLDSYALIVMLNVTDLPDTEINRIDRYTASGGGLAWFTGDRTDPIFTNRLFAMNGLFPLPLANQPSPSWTDRQREEYRLDDSPKLVLPDPDHPIVSGLVPFRQVFRFLRVERHWPPATESGWREGSERVLALPARSWSNAARRDELRQRILKLTDTTTDPYTRPELASKLDELGRRAALLRGRLAAGSQFEVVTALEAFLDLGQGASASSPNSLKAAWESPLLVSTARALTELIREIQEGNPLLVCRDRGSGRVAAFLTSAGPQLSKPAAPGESNQGWNEWANGFLSATYPILIQDMLLDLLRSNAKATDARPLAPSKIALPLNRYDSEARVFFSTQAQPTQGIGYQSNPIPARIVQTSENAELILPPQPHAGSFSISLFPQGRRLADDAPVEHRGLAVNVDTSESDLARATRAMMIGGPDDKAKNISLAVPGYEPEDTREQFKRRPIDASETPWIFLILMLILVSEQALALRISNIRPDRQPPIGGTRR